MCVSAKPVAFVTRLQPTTSTRAYKEFIQNILHLDIVFASVDRDILLCQWVFGQC